MKAAEKLEVNMTKGYESRMTRLETINEMIGNNLIEIKLELKKIDGKMDGIKTEILTNLDIIEKELVAKIDQGRKESWSQMRWVLGFIIALFASPLFNHILKLVHLQ